MHAVGKVVLAVLLVGGGLAGAVSVASAADGVAAPPLEVPRAGASAPADGGTVPTTTSAGITDGTGARAVGAATGLTPATNASDLPARVEPRPTSTTTVQSVDSIVLNQSFRLTPERPGEVRAVREFTIPERVVGLRTTVPAVGNVTATEGFSATNETIYEWDGQTASPSITYALPVNETGTPDHTPENGSLLAADVGEWALFTRPATQTTWEYYGDTQVPFDRRTVTPGGGAAGEWLVYLGNAGTYNRTADGQTIRLAVPAAANMSESPADVLDGLARASTDLAVGDRDESVFAVAAPTEGVPWAVRGLSPAGTADFWVGADERLSTPDNIWVHEYVHTRQDYRPTSATRWTKEGFATYYAAYHAFRYESVTFDEFANALAVADGTVPSNETVVANGTATANGTGNVTLSAPDTWENRSQYQRGALVAAQIDRRIRLASDGERTIDAVLADMNADADRYNASEFFAAVANAGNESVADAIRSAVTTDRPVSMWNRSQHRAAFGGLPARFVYGLPPPTDPDGYRVRGPFRNESLGEERPLTLVAGETLVVDASVRNVGESAGRYDASLRIDGDVVAVRRGRIPVGDRRSVPLNHTFDRPGEYVIGVGNETTTVRVIRPAPASIVGVDLSPTTVDQYGVAQLTVTLRNDAAIPAARTVSVTRDGQTVTARPVRIGPNDTATTTIDVHFPEAGRTVVTVDGGHGESVTVEPRDPPPTVETGSSNATDAGTASSAVGPGIGAIVVVAAVVAVLVLARSRR